MKKNMEKCPKCGYKPIEKESVKCIYCNKQLKTTKEGATCVKCSKKHIKINIPAHILEECIKYRKDGLTWKEIAQNTNIGITVLKNRLIEHYGYNEFLQKCT